MNETPTHDDKRDTVAMHQGNNPFKRGAVKYLRAGWSPIALPAKDKFPPPAGWTGYHGERVKLKDGQFTCPVAWMHKEHNIGLRMPQTVIGIDVDDYGSKDGGATFARFEAELGELPATWRSTSRVDDDVSGIRFYRVPAGRIWAGVLEDGGDVEIIAWHDRYAAVAPSIHPEGREYRWFCPCGELASDDCDVLGCARFPDVEDLPELPEAWVEHLDKGSAAERSPKADLKGSDAWEWLQGLPGNEPCQVVTEALEEWTSVLAGGGSRHDAGRNGAMALIRLGERGHQGVMSALDQFEQAWRDAVADRGPKPANEWESMVTGGVAVALGGPTPEAEKRCCGTRSAQEVFEQLGAPSDVLKEPRRLSGKPSEQFDADDSQMTLLDVMLTAGWTEAEPALAKGVGLWRPGIEPVKGEPTPEPSAVISEGRLRVGTGDAAVAPLKPGKSYSKFKAFAALFHSGDYKEAVKDLRHRGLVREPGEKLTMVWPADGTGWEGINAEILMKRYTLASGCYSLRTLNGEFVQYVGSHYVKQSDRQVAAIITRRLKTAVCVTDDGERPFPVSSYRVEALVKQLKLETHIEDSVELNSWDVCDVDACATIDKTARYRSVRNGLLNVKTGEVLPRNPAFITLNSIPFAFDKGAGDPELTLATLAQQFPEDTQQHIDAFQEYAGFMVFGSNREKMYAIIALLGQSGSGKSMWGLTLEALIGAEQVAHPTPAMLGTNFGKQGCVGKAAVIMSDADVKMGAPGTAHLKTVSGGDPVGFDQKNRDHFDGYIDAPHMVISNGIPQMNDPSGAVAARFYLLWFTVKFRGEASENKDLPSQILDQEATELLAWLWRGYRRAVERGKLMRVENTTTAEIEAAVRTSTSPMQAFLQERCVAKPTASAPKAVLHEAFNDWAAENGEDQLNNRAFGMRLREAMPTLKDGKVANPAAETDPKQPARVNGLMGIRLKTHDEI